MEVGLDRRMSRKYGAALALSQTPRNEAICKPSRHGSRGRPQTSTPWTIGVDSAPSRVCISVNRRNVALAEYLLSRGASVNHGDASALHILIARPSTSYSTDMVGLLLRAGADVNARDINGESPIAWAIEKFGEDDLSDRELTRLLQFTVQLLRHGASLADGFFGLDQDDEHGSRSRRGFH